MQLQQFWAQRRRDVHQRRLLKTVCQPLFQMVSRFIFVERSHDRKEFDDVVTIILGDGVHLLKAWAKRTTFLRMGTWKTQSMLLALQINHSIYKYCYAQPFTASLLAIQMATVHPPHILGGTNDMSCTGCLRCGTSSCKKGLPRRKHDGWYLPFNVMVLHLQTKEYFQEKYRSSGTHHGCDQEVANSRCGHQCLPRLAAELNQWTTDTRQ